MNENASHGSPSHEAVGIIVPVDWDSCGNPNAWAISTYDENLYRIDPATEKGRELGSFLGRKMLLTGLLGETDDHGNHRIMRVQTYVCLDDRQPIP